MKCFNTDLMINSESGLASKVIGPFSSHCSEKDKSDTLFSGFELMRRRPATWLKFDYNTNLFIALEWQFHDYIFSHIIYTCKIQFFFINT